AFALAYRFFPGLLHIEPAPEPTVAGTAPSTHAPVPWSATPRTPQPPAEPKEAPLPEETGTSFADAVRMGPPAPTTKEVAALLRRARAAEEKGALLDPNSGAIVLYRAALAGAEGNLEAVTALERIGGAMRD